MQNLDEKKEIILLILQKLKVFNPEIGNYEKSVLNNNLLYAVKLDNGRINLPAEVVHDFEHSPAFISDEVYKEIALKFSQDTITKTVSLPKLESSVINKSSNQTSKNKKNGATKNLIILGVLIVLGLTGYYLYTKINREQETIQVEDDKSTIRSNINSYVTVETNDYQHYEIGGIVGLKVIVTNNTNYLLENVKVRITYIKKNGEVWRNRDIDFSMIDAQNSMTMTIPDTDRGVSVQCRVVGIKSSSLGL